MTEVNHRVNVDVNARDNASPTFIAAKGNFESFVNAIRSNGLAFVFVGQEIRNWSNVVRQSVDDSVQKFANFDKAMTQFSTLATDSGTKAKGMGREINAMAIQFGLGATEVAEAARDVAAMGLSVSDSMIVVKEGTKLAVGGLSDVNSASTIIVNTLKQFNMSFSEAGHVTDVFAATANKTAANVSDLAISMQYAGPIAAGMGVSLEELSAAMGLMRNAGIEASIVGTNLRQMFIQLQAPSREAIMLIAETGISFREETSAGRNLAHQIKALATENKSLSSSQGILTERLEDYRVKLDSARNSQDGHRRAIQNINGDLMRHNGAYRSLEIQIQSATRTLSSMDDQLRRLEGTYGETGRRIEDITLEIMMIERAASREGRELTEGEIRQINSLRGSVDDLRITQMRESRFVDVMRERIESETRTMKDAEDAQKAMRTEAVEPHEAAIRSLDKTIEKIEKVISASSDAVRDNAKALKANEQAIDDATKAYSVSGGQMKTIAEVIREVDRVTRDMTVAQKENFLNTIFGVRGMAAFNTLNQLGVENLEALTKELESSSDAFGGIGYSANAAREMLKNTATELARVNEKLDVFNKEAGRGAAATALTLKGAWADFKMGVATTNPVLARAIGIFGDLVASFGMVIAQFLIFYPLLSTTRAAIAVNTATMKTHTAAVTANAVAVSAESAAIANGTANIYRFSAGKAISATTLRAHATAINTDIFAVQGLTTAINTQIVSLRANTTAFAEGTVASLAQTRATATAIPMMRANATAINASTVATTNFTRATATATAMSRGHTTAIASTITAKRIVTLVERKHIASVAASTAALAVNTTVIGANTTVTQAAIVWTNRFSVAKAGLATAATAASVRLAAMPAILAGVATGFRIAAVSASGFIVALGPIGWIILAIMAIVSAAILIWQNWAAISKAVGNAGQWLGDRFADMGKSIWNSTEGIRGAISKAREWFAPIGNELGRTAELVGSIFGRIGHIIQLVGARVVNDVRDAFGRAWGVITDGFEKAGEAADKFLEDTGIKRGIQRMGEGISWLGGVIHDNLVNAWNSLSDTVNKFIIGPLGDFVNGIKDALGGALKDFNDWLEGVDAWFAGLEDSLTGHSLVPAMKSLEEAASGVMGVKLEKYLKDTSEEANTSDDVMSELYNVMLALKESIDKLTLAFTRILDVKIEDFFSGLYRAIFRVSDALTGHSLVDDMYALKDSMRAVINSGFVSYMRSVGNSVRIPIMSDFGGTAARGSISPTTLPAAAGGASIGGGGTTNTTRNTTNSPVINITVRNLDFSDPRVISALGDAVKRYTERA